MKVLILSKTRMERRHCVGALTLDTFRPLRLLLEGGHPQPAETPYEIGQIWDLDFTPFEDARPPHSEGVCVKSGGKLQGKQEDLKRFLMENAPIWRGAPATLFGGMLKRARDGAGFIARDAVPERSTGFWIADRDFVLEPPSSDFKVRYGFPDAVGISRILYSGVERPAARLPAGALLRVSLARWGPESAPEAEQRCYLRLSGWYL